MARKAKSRKKPRVLLNAGAIKVLFKFAPINRLEAARRAGVDSSLLYRISSGTRETILYPTLLKIAKAYEVEPDWLMECFVPWPDDRVQDLDEMMKGVEI